MQKICEINVQALPSYHSTLSCLLLCKLLQLKQSLCLKLIQSLSRWQTNIVHSFRVRHTKTRSLTAR